MIVNPQIENGHTDIANEILDYLCSFRIPGECRQVFDAIMRKTWGWHKKEDRIAESQLVEMTGINRQNVWRSISKLKKHGLVIKTDCKLRINKNYIEWKPFLQSKQTAIKMQSKVITLAIKTDYKMQSKVTDTKEKKETIQKKEANQFLEFYNETRKEKRKSIKTWYSNFIIWREVYSLEEMKRAISKANHSVFFDSAMNPDLFFRTKNKNGQCDYIGDLLNTKSKELLEYEKEIEGIKIIKE